MAALLAALSVRAMFERILVGYAGDQAGRDSVLLASRLAGLTGAAVSVAFPYHPLLAAVSGDVAEQRARDELRAMLPGEELPEHARFHWSPSPWPIHALHELAEYEAADLIVFGAARERLGRRHVDLMERMVHGAPCAVAVAPDRYAEGEPTAIARVGAGFADTEEGRAAVSLAAALARRAGQPLQIVAGTGLSGALLSYAAGSPALPDVERRMYAETRAALERVAEKLPLEPPPALDLRRGDPAKVLADATRTLDLLVLGSRAYGPLRHALLGSVSADVMRAAHCPVLVLPRTVAGADAALAETALAETAVAER
jgi:nucleotide-binding universal stress UspA family protein